MLGSIFRINFSETVFEKKYLVFSYIILFLEKIILEDLKMFFQCFLENISLKSNFENSQSNKFSKKLLQKTKSKNKEQNKPVSKEQNKLLV